MHRARFNASAETESILGIVMGSVSEAACGFLMTHIERPD
jgi:hypothetical protein